MLNKEYKKSNTKIDVMYYQTVFNIWLKMLLCDTRTLHAGLLIKSLIAKKVENM